MSQGLLSSIIYRYLLNGRKMIGVWTCWTNGPSTADPQGLTQGSEWSTLGVVGALARVRANFGLVLCVDDHWF